MLQGYFIGEKLAVCISGESNRSSKRISLCMADSLSHSVSGEIHEAVTRRFVVMKIIKGTVFNDY